MTAPLDQIEERFLQFLEQAPLPLAALNGLLADAAAAGDPARADALAELLQDTLAASEAPDPRPILSLLGRRAAHRSDAGFRETARALCRRFQPGGQDLTGYCGFDAEHIPLAVCLARLQLLLDLTPGTPCYSKSWGFGMVRDRNDMTGRITVDFDSKPGHALGFAFVAESCHIPAADHPLVQRHRDRAMHDQLRRERPGDLLKSVLRHYGPMNAVVLEETMIRDGLVPVSDWKSFWTGARQALKTDPAVLLPARKTDPLQFLEQPQERFNADWLVSLAAANEPDTILAAIAERESEAPLPLSPDEIGVFTDRLAHVMRAAPAAPVAIMTNALLTARRLALPLAAELAASGWRRLAQRAQLDVLLANLPVRRLRELFEAWFEADAQTAAQGLLDLAPDASLRIIPLVVSCLIERGHEAALAERLRPYFQGREKASADWILFLLRDPDFAARLDWIPHAALPAAAVAQLEAFDTSRRKTRELPAEYLSRTDRLQPFGDVMTAEQRRDLMRRLQLLTHGPRVEAARGMMAAWIKVYPDLAAAASAAAPDPGDADGEAVRLTSWRSWRERQRQLERLVKDEIPANAREIGIARSYGDLRENHEYKAAKEHQTILYRRQGELERDLTLVKGTDFAGLPHDRAGLATSVRLRHERGAEETVVILGEWDTDPALNMLSCRSERAQRLQDAEPGEQRQLPGEDGTEETVTILSVDPLPEPVRQWIQATDPAAPDKPCPPAAATPTEPDPRKEPGHAPQ